MEVRVRVPTKDKPMGADLVKFEFEVEDVDMGEGEISILEEVQVGVNIELKPVAKAATTNQMIHSGARQHLI